MYRQTSQQVYNTALRLLCSRVHAEEVTQEVYVQVWQQAGGYDSGKGSVLISRFDYAGRVDFDSEDTTADAPQVAKQ